MIKTLNFCHWQETVVQGPLEKLHKENSYASSTPFTDGRRVFVTFRVGDDIFVAAHELTTGKQLWRIQPGTHTGEWGFSNPPILYKDKIFFDGDSKGKSFLIALNCTDVLVQTRAGDVMAAKVIAMSIESPDKKSMANRQSLSSATTLCRCCRKSHVGRIFTPVGQ